MTGGDSSVLQSQDSPTEEEKVEEGFRRSPEENRGKSMFNQRPADINDLIFDGPIKNNYMCTEDIGDDEGILHQPRKHLQQSPIAED